MDKPQPRPSESRARAFRNILNVYQARRQNRVVAPDVERGPQDHCYDLTETRKCTRVAAVVDMTVQAFGLILMTSFLFFLMHPISAEGSQFRTYLGINDDIISFMIVASTVAIIISSLALYLDCLLYAATHPDEDRLICLRKVNLWRFVNVGFAVLDYITFNWVMLAIRCCLIFVVGDYVLALSSDETLRVGFPGSRPGQRSLVPDINTILTRKKP